MRRSVDALVRGESRVVARDDDRRASDFYLETSSSRVRSTVTDIEDVPYVSSPYFPASFLSSADYNISSGDKGESRLEDGAKDCEKDAKNEHVLLDDVRVLLTEFVPMGSNEMVAFCDKLGARERVPGACTARCKTSTRVTFPTNSTWSRRRRRDQDENQSLGRGRDESRERRGGFTRARRVEDERGGDAD